MIIPFFILTVILCISFTLENNDLFVDEDGNLFCSDGYNIYEQEKLKQQ